MIALELSRGRNAMGIWQDLVDDHGFARQSEVPCPRTILAGCLSQKRVTFFNPESGFAVLRVQGRGPGRAAFGDGDCTMGNAAGQGPLLLLGSGSTHKSAPGSASVGWTVPHRYLYLGELPMRICVATSERQNCFDQHLGGHAYAGCVPEQRVHVSIRKASGSCWKPGWWLFFSSWRDGIRDFPLQWSRADHTL